MNKNLIIYSAILATVYVACIIAGVSEMSGAFMTGFKKGYSEAGKGNHNEIFSFEVKPLKGYYSFPTVIINEKTGEKMQAEAGSFMVYQTNSVNPISGSDKLLKVFGTLLSLLVIGILIYIPVQTFKMIRSVMKMVIFEQNNIKRLRKIGLAVLMLFICKRAASYFQYLIASHALQIRDYEPVVKNTHVIILFMGITICIFAEILKSATAIKEEQDLTV